MAPPPLLPLGTTAKVPVATVAPERVDWDDFLANHFNWSSGEHVVIIGPTGSGKSVLMRSLLWRRDWAVVLCSKKKDATYTDYLKEGYTRAVKWPPPLPPRGQVSQHVLLWPKITTIADLDTLNPVFRKALNAVFVDEGWAVGLDDLYYLCQEAKLQKPIAALNQQVRSLGVSLVACMQRPAWVPRTTWDQASHAFIRTLADADDVRTIRGLSRVSARELEEYTRLLRRYEWLYLPVAHGDTQPPIIVKPPK